MYLYVYEEILSNLRLRESKLSGFVGVFGDLGVRYEKSVGSTFLNDSMFELDSVDALYSEDSPLLILSVIQDTLLLSVEIPSDDGSNEMYRGSSRLKDTFVAHR